MSADPNKRIELTCSACNTGFFQTLDWFVNHSAVECPNCGASYDIRLEDEGKPIRTPGSFFTKIAGVTHTNSDGTSRQRIIGQCHIGEELRLEREPDNPVDPNAIGVFRLTGEQLGYIPAHVASSGLAKQMDEDYEPRCRISDLTGLDRPTRGVNIQVGDRRESAFAERVARPESSSQHKVAADIPGTIPSRHWVTWFAIVSVLVIGAIVLLIHNIESPEEKASKVRRAFRELNLPLALGNDQLRLQNDQLARKKGVPGTDGKKVSASRISIDQFAIAQATMVLETARKLDSYLSTPGGGKMRTEYLRWDAALNDANDKCRTGIAAAKTLDEARAACAELRAIAPD